ncbi:MAG: response regulator transcription factor, partial [Patulibacter sp.]|nr:response regulator transcription factor [Patulibacter sp.]
VMVIDGDVATAEITGRYLLRAGYEIRTAHTASSALSLHGERPADLIVLDLGPSGPASLEILRRMHADENPALGVVLIVDREHQVQRDAGLVAGADDYVVKPFSPRELVARVDATLRRSLPRSSPPSHEPQTLTAGDLQIDIAGHRVRLAGTEIHLAQKEFDLLLFFAQSPGVAHSRDELMQRVWGYEEYSDTSTVTVHVKRLRDKIHLPGTPALLHTVRGIGYRFEPPSPA